MKAQRLQAGDRVPDFDFRTPWAPRQNFYDIIGNDPAVLVSCVTGAAPFARWKWPA